MATTVPALPNRFPCWVRATYSWGGESKKDLGFIEGDLIECLNAGDGSWWMGRLRRDKRAVGLFPSNFVRVLDESFQPVSRASSPMPSPNGSLSTAKTSPQKTKTFRKPFQAYVELGPKTSPPKPAAAFVPALQPIPKAPKTHSRQTSSRESNTSPSRGASYMDLHAAPSRQLSFMQGSTSPSRQPSYLDTSISPTRQNISHERSRPASPHPQFVEDITPTRLPNYFEPAERTTSPQPYNYHGSRAPSPVQFPQYGSRTPSPAPPAQYRPSSASYTGEYEDAGSSPPPPPPPVHRVPYSAPAPGQRSSTPPTNERYPQPLRASSPTPLSPGLQSPMIPGLTPSPLRDAMEDVMSSLEGMTMRRNETSPSPNQEEQPQLDLWSPEDFDEFRAKPHARSNQRPRSSLGIASSQRDYDDHEDDYQRHRPNHDGPTQLYDYKERMENDLPRHRAASPRPPDELFFPEHSMAPPVVPSKPVGYEARPSSSSGPNGSLSRSTRPSQELKKRKSAYELGKSMLDRSFTTKSSATSSSSGLQSVATNGTSSTDRTSQSVMSGHSAGGFSATSAGSLAKRKWGSIRGRKPQNLVDVRNDIANGFGDAGLVTRPQTPSHYSKIASRPASRAAGEGTTEDCGGLGGLMAPKKKKSGFFKKLVESAKTGAASARGTIASGQIETPRSPIKNMLPNGVTSVAGGTSNAARDMGLGGGKSDQDWVQVRRDVNRSNSLSQNEKIERIERCQMMDYPVIAPVDVLLEDAEGDEDINGLPIREPIDFQSVNLQLVDKSARFVNSLPPMTNATALAQGYVCRPYRSEVQKLRAIFTWVSEKIGWEEDFEGEVNTRRVIQMRRGCSEEVAVLVSEMCSAVGLHAEVVRGFLKSAHEMPNGDPNVRSNHWWNAVVVDGSWRILDCSLAAPTNPKRSHYSSASHQVAEPGFFLARPLEICYTHIPTHYAQQHIVPPIPADILLALPCASPSYFKSSLQMLDYDTSLLRIEDLELLHVQFACPSDIECVAQVEARGYAHDVDGDIFESGETAITRALAQADWTGGQKRYTVKAYLPSEPNGSQDGERQAVLKVYAGKRGLMHSVKDNPYPLAFALPIIHHGANPPYEFLLRHPTPHAQRHDLYVAQPQCRRLAINNTFVFAVRQHPSSHSVTSPMESSTSGRAPSPSPLTRPTSAMSMISSITGSNAGSEYFSQASSNSSGPGPYGQAQQKPAKLAIQAPSGKILRLMRKSDNSVSSAEAGDGGIWETIIKISERGVWRGLVLADRSARWCVFGEWECV